MTSQYIARCFQQNLDPSRRNLVAVIEAAEESRYSLKVLTDENQVVFEKSLDSVLASWYLGAD